MKTVYPKTAELVFAEFLSFPKIPFEFLGVVMVQDTLMNSGGPPHRCYLSVVSIYPGSET